MTIFDLIFLALVLVSVVTLLTASVLAVSGSTARAGAIVRRWGIGFGAYMAVVAAVSLALPRRVVKVGEAMCSDDWCLAVERVERVGGAYRIGFRMESRAARVTQREYGVTVYLTDGEGRRWAPRAAAEEPAFDTPIRPQETIETARVFDVPAGVNVDGLVVRHDSGFPIGWFIVGYDTWFRKPTLVRLAG